MIKKQTISPPMDENERAIRDIDRKIDQLKIAYNLFFSGELDIPPEEERAAVEAKVKKLLYSGHRSPRLKLLMDNVSSKFTLYNNKWLKRLNDMEIGLLVKKKGGGFESKKGWTTKIFGVSLNREDSFDNLYDKYCDLFPKASSQIKLDKEKLINSIKTKMISTGIVDAKAAISVESGKLKIRLKK